MAGTVEPEKNGGKVTPDIVTVAAPRQNDRYAPLGLMALVLQGLNETIESGMRYGWYMIG